MEDTIKQELVDNIPENTIVFLFVGITKEGDRIVMTNMNEPSICLQADLLKQEVLQDIMMRSVFPSKPENTH